MSDLQSGAPVRAGDLVRRGLAALGVETVYGAPLAGVPVVDVPAGVVGLFAEAHLLVARTRCAVHHGAGALTILDRRAAITPPGPPAGWASASPAMGSAAGLDPGTVEPGGGAEAGTREPEAGAVGSVGRAEAGTVGSGAGLLGGAESGTVEPGGGADPGAVGTVGGAESGAVAIDDDDALVGAWREVERRLRAGRGLVALRLGLDPERAVADRLPDRPDPVDRWVEPDPAVVDRLRGARAPVLLVGPGVAEPALVPGLHALAAAGSLGVLNTWGAKGVFDWRSRHHWATVGLQAHDLARGGLAEADVIVAAGLDPRETPGLDALGVAVVTLAPGALGPVAQLWGRPRLELAVPPLRAGLARVTQDGWRRTGAPLAPSQVTLAYGRATGTDGLVAADPGTAGYWVARTFATTGLGGAVVPARADAAGLAAACVAVARLRRPGRAALAVVDADPRAGPASLPIATPATSGIGGERGAASAAASGVGGSGVPALTTAGARGEAVATTATTGAGSDGGGRIRGSGRRRDGIGGRESIAPGEATASVVEAAARLGVAVPVERWCADGPALDATAHGERLGRALAGERPVTLDVATDAGQLAQMIEVAGEIVAWRPGSERS
ncbi:MAG TPA: hypothetical protein VK306_02955 [Acidimicrobiales bacterium]|nr:hypothetical protein [Acidimicrobiales bacterium]